MTNYYALASQNALMQTMLNYDNEIGSHAKTPKLINLEDFQRWSQRFRSHLGVVDPNCVAALDTQYVRPTIEIDGVGTREKTIDQMTVTEKAKHDHEIKTYSTLTMALPKNIFHQFSHIKTSAALYAAIQARSLGNTLESKKSMLKYQYKNINILSNETVGEMLTRYCHLLAELNRYELHKDESDRVDTLKSALPDSFSTYIMVLTEGGYFKNEDLTCMEFVEKLEKRLYEFSKTPLN